MQRKEAMRTKLHAPTIGEVRLTSGFWAERQKINGAATLDVSFHQLEQTGRIDALSLRWKPGDPNPPHIFWDSDVAKWVESACYVLIQNPEDYQLRARVDQVVDRIIASQQLDGYINSHFTVVAPQNRWRNLRDHHELYCAGHLLEAAIAHYEATQVRAFLDAMLRYIVLIDSVFGVGPGKRRGYPGHQEIELALMRLYELNRDPRHLALASYFVNERGQVPYYFEQEAATRGEPVPSPEMTIKRREYAQWHIPARDQEEIFGHAVRALYFFCGMADVGFETDDNELLMACRALWEDTTLRKMYVHGGVGSSSQNEGITYAYDLPNETAYAETCAAIALFLFSHRMLQIDAQSRYADIMERALYNNILSGVSLDGARFFYQNPLAANLNGTKQVKRPQWYSCSCCPNNLSRLIASLGKYLYSLNGNQLYVHLYASCELNTEINGISIRLIQETNYPWDGLVSVTIAPAQPLDLEIFLRWPDWATSGTLSLNGAEPNPINPSQIERGYLKITRGWTSNFSLIVNYPMEACRVYSHPSVGENLGKVAIQRGPLIYCLEETDNGSGLDSIIIPNDVPLQSHWDPELLGGVLAIDFEGYQNSCRIESNALYRFERPHYSKKRFSAIPYFMWANRSCGEMVVWLLTSVGE
jgi:DUF1680 family protein